ncbi:venom dipeptidyl peptidase 4 [Anabrus simplex]|uniref:venom dipeptidyl peptidase 4 n=1 Tax=Anabrus simplex TaxID=316456 RepID=UPI0035A3116C
MVNMDIYSSVDFSMSSDKQYLALASNVKQEFNHSVLAEYIIHNQESFVLLASGLGIQLLKWSPVGNSMVYVRENNIYYVQEGTTDSFLYPFQLTYDGEMGVIFNGVPDWIYREEVMKDGCALWFSPNGKSLVYATFNDTEVQKVYIPRYGDTEGSSVSSLRYPKVGTKNPTVVLKYQTLVNPQVPPRDFQNIFGEEYILSHVSWANNDEVFAVWTSRTQNQANIVSYNITDQHLVPRKEHFLAESSGWLDFVTLKYTLTGDKFFIIQSQHQESNLGKYLHLTQITRRPQTIVTPLTSGPRVVTEIYGVDTNGNIYFQATENNEPSRRQVYMLEQSTERCISCNELSLDGKPCGYASASFSRNMSYLALTCSGPDVPYVKLYKSQPFSLLHTWENNTAPRQTLKEYVLPVIKDIQVEMSDGFTAQVRLWLPPDLDQNGTSKYPMVVYVYGAPNTQLITDEFQVGWGHYLTTNRRYIYAMIDGHGSGFRGDWARFSTYLSLGTKEIQDQIAVVRHLLSSYSFIDANRTGVWGWGHGGYSAAMVLAKDTEGTFKCGISVAPVTSWFDFASIYTERYMLLPIQGSNLQGYKNANLVDLVDNFKNNQFLLIHGTADHDVHYQQSMLLAKALQSQGKLFFQQSYGDEDHYLGTSLQHMYQTQDDFWSRCFQDETSPPKCHNSQDLRKPTSSVFAVLVLLRIYLL